MLLVSANKSISTSSNYLLSTPPEVTFFFLLLLMFFVTLSVLKKAGYWSMIMCGVFAIFSVIYTIAFAKFFASTGHGLVYFIINALVAIGYIALSRRLWNNQYANKREWI